MGIPAITARRPRTNRSGQTTRAAAPFILITMTESQAVGYLAVAIATLFFGSNFVAVKRYETYDG